MRRVSSDGKDMNVSVRRERIWFMFFILNGILNFNSLCDESEKGEKKADGFLTGRNSLPIIFCNCVL